MNGELKNKLKTMKTRTLSYTHEPLSEIEEWFSVNPNALALFEPSNYYASKKKYLSATIYSSTDYSENYVEFQEMICRGDKDDKKSWKSELYPVTQETLKAALARFKIHI